MAEARSHGGSIVLLGFAPDEADSELGYIVPGLGDAGDRLYGTV